MASVCICQPKFLHVPKLLHTTAKLDVMIACTLSLQCDITILAPQWLTLILLYSLCVTLVRLGPNPDAPSMKLKSI